MNHEISFRRRIEDWFLEIERKTPMTTMVKDLLESVVEQCEGMVESLSEKKNSAYLQELVEEMGRLRKKASSSRSHPHRLGALAQGYRVATMADTIGSPTAASLVKELEKVLGDHGVSSFQQKGVKLPHPRFGDSMALWSGSTVHGQDFTVLYRPIADAKEGTVTRRLPGLKSSAGTYLKPHIEVAVTPFLSRLISMTESLVADGKDLGKKEKELFSSVLQSVKDFSTNLSVVDRNGAAASSAVVLLGSVLSGLGGTKAGSLLNEIRDFKRWLGGEANEWFSTGALLEKVDEIKAATEEMSTDESSTNIAGCISSVREAVKSKDRDGAIEGLASLLTLSRSLKAGKSLEAKCTVLLRLLGAVVINEDNLPSFEWWKDEFENEYSEKPVAGKGRGAILELKSAGVAVDGRLIVRPRVVVSRGEVSRFHQVLDQLEGLIREEEIREETFGPALSNARENSFSRSNRELEGREGLELIFDLVSGVFFHLPTETQTSVRTFLKSVYGADVVEFPPGEFLDHFASDDEPELGRYPYEVERVRHAADPGIVIETLRLGLQSPFFSVPAKIQVSRGDVVEDPFLLKVRDVNLAEATAGEECLSRIRLISCTAGRHFEVDQDNQPALVAEVICLYEDLKNGSLGDISRDDVSSFLARQGFHKFPQEGSLLTAEDLSKDTKKYEVTYQRDDSVGAGGVVAVDAHGFTTGDRVARRARVVVSLGSEPELSRIFDRVWSVTEGWEKQPDLVPAGEDVLDRKPLVDEHRANLKRIYSSRVEPRFGCPDFALFADETVWRKELAKPAVEMFAEAELIRAAFPDCSKIASELDRILENEFPSFLSRVGIQVSPSPGDRVDLDNREMDVEPVFHDQVPEGRVVHVEKRSIHRSSSTDAERNLVRKGKVQVSLGPLPELLRHLQWLVATAGDEHVPSAAAFLRTLEQDTDPSLFRTDSVYESMASKIARSVDDFDARVFGLGEIDPEGAEVLRAGVTRLVRFLAEKKICLEPIHLNRPLRNEKYCDLFESGSQAFQYQSTETEAGLSRGSIVSIENRALTVNGEVIARGNLVVHGGMPDGLLSRLSRIGELCPEVEAVTISAMETIRNLDDQALVSTIEGKPCPPEISLERVRSALSVIEVLQGVGSPSSPAYSEVWAEGRSLLSDLSTRFDLRVYPGAHDDPSSLMEDRREGDEIVAEFGEEERGTIQVSRFGYQGSDMESPFSVRVSLGPEPLYMQRCREHAHFRRYFDETEKSTFSEVENEIASILESFKQPDARPDDLADFVVPRFCRIHRLVEDGLADRVLASELLRFMADNLSVEVYPAAGSTYETYRDHGVPERNIEIDYDYYLDDYSIDQSRVESFGVCLGTRIYSFPRFTVNRKEKSPQITLLLDRLAPILTHGREIATGAEKEAIEKIWERFKRYQLLAREEQGSPEARTEVETLLNQVAEALPDANQVPTPEGMMPLANVVRDLKTRLQQMG